ncbi:MFS transporter [Gordonia sp. JH63]|uniref:MFS transporter n=1 Tax=Gordonia sp. JH63 TaxID=2698900 RepID=UPI0031B8754C
MRVKLEDTPEFEEMAESQDVATSPLSDVVRNSPKSVLKVVGIAIAMNGSGYIGLMYFNAYLINDLGFGKVAVHRTSAIAIVLACATIPISGMMADCFGRRPVLFVGCIAYIVIAFPVFIIVGATGSIVVVGLVCFVYMTLNGVVPVLASAVHRTVPPGHPLHGRLAGVQHRHHRRGRDRALCGGSARRIDRQRHVTGLLGRRCLPDWNGHVGRHSGDQQVCASLRRRGLGSKLQPAR